MYNRKNYELLEYFVIFVDNLNFNNFKLLLYIMWQDFGLQTGFKLLLDIFLRRGSADVAVVDFGSKPKNKRKDKNFTYMVCRKTGNFVPWVETFAKAN